MRIVISKTTFLCLFLLIVDGVFGVDSDGVKSVSVTEGDSVTLKTDVTERQILWMFGHKRTPIAQIVEQHINMFSSNVIFGDRLKMDRQTGSLTITNITTKNSGLYKLQIISDTGTLDTTFNITVYAPLPIPRITHNSAQCPSSSSLQNCSVLCSVVNVSHVTLSWLKGNSLLSSISASDLSISLSLPLEVDDQDNNTYSCQISNPIRNQTTHLDISELCKFSVHPQSRLYAALIPAVILALLAIVTYCIYRKRKISGPKGDYCEPSAQATEAVQRNQEEVTYTETTFVPNVQHKNDKGTEQTIYSTVVKH